MILQLTPLSNCKLLLWTNSSNQLESITSCRREEHTKDPRLDRSSPLQKRQPVHQRHQNGRDTTSQEDNAEPCAPKQPERLNECHRHQQVKLHKNNCVAELFQASPAICRAHRRHPTGRHLLVHRYYFRFYLYSDCQKWKFHLLYVVTCFIM